MSGSKAPDFDAYGLFRAAHSHNPTRKRSAAGWKRFYLPKCVNTHIFFPDTIEKASETLHF